MMYFWPILIVFLNTFMGAYAAYLLKKGTNKRYFAISHLSQKRYYYLFAGLFLYMFGALIFVGALKFAPLSILFPITSLTLIWSYLLANKRLDEEINVFKIIGVIFIIFGVILITLF